MESTVPGVEELRPRPRAREEEAGPCASGRSQPWCVCQCPPGLPLQNTDPKIKLRISRWGPQKFAEGENICVTYMVCGEKCMIESSANLQTLRPHVDRVSK